MSGRVRMLIGAKFKPHAVCLHVYPKADDVHQGHCSWESDDLQDAMGRARELAKAHAFNTGHRVAVDIIDRKVYGVTED